MIGPGVGAAQRRRRWLAAALLSLLALVSAGCWDRVEVNDLAIVEGVALDKAGPRSLELTVALAVPSRINPPGSPGAGGLTLPPLAVEAAQGRTVMDAAAAMQEKLGRRLFWAHVAVILLGEDLAREGVAPALEFFSRHRQPRLRTLIGVVPGKAADVLATMSPIEPSTATAIRKMGMLQTGVVTTVRDFLAMLVGEGEEPVAPRIEAVHRGAAQPGTLETSAGSSPSAPAPLAQRNPLQPSSTGAAVFKGDRLVGFLDHEETRGLLWVRNEVARATVTVTLGEPGRYVSFDLVRTQAHLRPRFVGRRVVMEVGIVSEHDLAEDSAGVDVDDPRAIALLEEELAEEMAGRIRRVARKVQQEFRSDVFGFGAAVRRNDPRRWKQIRTRWDRVFPEVQLDLYVQAFVRRIGLSSRPLGMRRSDVLSADRLERLLRDR